MTSVTDDNIRSMHLNGYWHGVTRADAAVRDVLQNPPNGSEGAATIDRSGTPNSSPATWYILGDLRGRDESDIPPIEVWFSVACTELQPLNAELTIDVDNGGRYRYAWTGTELRLMPRPNETPGQLR
jgi:hypothetical protein